MVATAAKTKTTNRGRKHAAVEEGSADDYKLYSAARAKRELHNANLAEMEEHRKRDSLVEVDAVNKQADAAARAVRDAFLAVPDRLASLLVGRTEKQIAMELRKEIRQTLTNVSIKVGRAK